MKELERIKAEKERREKEIRQLENRQKILLNKQHDAQRRLRTRRLIERGAILESILPLAPDLPGEEVKTFLIALAHLPGAAELADKSHKSLVCKGALIHRCRCCAPCRELPAYCVRDGVLRSPNPLCATGYKTPASGFPSPAT